jgi:uncharacterized protein (DUF2461 family)
MIRKSTLDFLRNLARNNDREWFAGHKDQYQLALTDASQFFDEVNDLKRIRLDILDQYKHWNRLLRSKGIQASFGDMQGDQVATAPRGFPKDHPAIDLLRHKQFWFEHSFSDREVLAKGFVDAVNRTYKRIRPFFDYMSDMLAPGSTGRSAV